MTFLTYLNPYIFHINLYDLLFLGTIFTGLTFALQLLFANRPGRNANLFAGLALLIVVMHLVWVLCIDIGLSTYFRQWSRLPLNYLSALGPMIYFWVRKMTSPGYKSGQKDLLHLSPLLLQVGIWALAVKESIATGAATYDTRIFGLLNPALQLLIFFSVIIYLYCAHRLIKTYYQQLKFNGGDRYRNKLRWLHRLIRGFGIIWLLWVPYAIASFYHRSPLAVHAYYILNLLLAIMMIRIAVAAFLKPEIVVSAQAAQVAKPTIPADLKQKGIRLKNAMEARGLYRDADLSLSSLAVSLDINAHDLSRTINVALKKNFNDFVNEYRIIEVTRKMQDPAHDHLTLLGIAFESGFNSKTTFNRTFKQMTGKSPAEYKSELKKERPYYNSERHPAAARVISYRKTTPMWANEKLNRSYMFKNYFKIAWRNVMRNKSYATINVTGLAIGIAACLLIFLIVQFETSFDNFHANKDNIYRVLTVNSGPDGTNANAGTPMPLTEGLKLDFPQIKQVSNIMLNDGAHYSAGGSDGSAVKKFKEDVSYYADPAFFGIFDFKWLAGDKNTALAEPNTIVLSRDEADKFFGDWHTAMGKIVRHDNKRDLKVTGIIENTPANTDFPMKVAVSWLTLIGKGGDFTNNAKDWISTFSDKNCYIILPAGTDVKRFNTNLAAFAKKHVPPPYNKNQVFQLQALKDMHYNTAVGVYGRHPFGKELINVISLIGLFLLIIACVNFINLATAQAVNRSKEVGIRKVLGSNRYQLLLQFISETLIITLFAVIFASIISWLTLPLLNNLLEIQLSGGFLADPLVISFLATVLTGVTLLAGFYPALVLSGFNPIEALKNKIKAGSSSGISLRRVLVVTQFCIAQFLVIGTLVLIYQMNYFKNKSLGFNKDAVITVPVPADSISRTRINALKDELLQQPGIKDISVSLYGPADNGGWFSDFRVDNAAKPVDFNASLKWADPEYFKLYGMQFVAGGPYAKTDTISGYVVNETLIHKLGITDPRQAIGKYIMLWDDQKKKAQITGVVKDFHSESLRYAIPPVLMAPWKIYYQKLNIKVQPTNLSQTLASVAGLWNKTYPEGVYEYQFLDKTVADFYKNEDQLSTLYKVFAGIAIFISCLGLYGLVSFMALQRIKEVGIRKTLGASVGNIVYLFSKEFTVLIVVAFVISAPLGYYFMDQWLQDFTYKITIGPEIFIVAILTSVAIAWASVGYKAIKASLADPTKSLRSE